MSTKKSHTIRNDYTKQTRWTYAEAAHYANVTENAVRVWASRKKFKKGFAVGTLKVDADSFIKYVQTGKAQCK